MATSASAGCRGSRSASRRSCPRHTGSAHCRSPARRPSTRSSARPGSTTSAGSARSSSQTRRDRHGDRRSSAATDAADRRAGRRRDLRARRGRAREHQLVVCAGRPPADRRSFVGDGQIEAPPSPSHRALRDPTRPDGPNLRSARRRRAARLVPRQEGETCEGPPPTSKPGCRAASEFAQRRAGRVAPHPKSLVRRPLCCRAGRPTRSAATGARTAAAADP
jgi:hypothetical protein